MEKILKDAREKHLDFIENRIKYLEDNAKNIEAGLCLNIVEYDELAYCLVYEIALEEINVQYKVFNKNFLKKLTGYRYAVEKNDTVLNILDRVYRYCNVLKDVTESENERIILNEAVRNNREMQEILKKRAEINSKQYIKTRK